MVTSKVLHSTYHFLSIIDNFLLDDLDFESDICQDVNTSNSNPPPLVDFGDFGSIDDYKVNPMHVLKCKILNALLILGNISENESQQHLQHNIAQG